MKKFELKQFVQDLNKNEFVKQCAIPLGFNASYPIIRVKNEKVFLLIPYTRKKATNRPGLKAVLPVEYLVTFELKAVLSIPSAMKGKSATLGYVGAKAEGFEHLRYEPRFEKIDFDAIMDLFPHRELAQIGKEEYSLRVDKVYEGYDAVINDLLGIEKCSGVDRLELKQQLELLIGPAAKQMYKMIDEDFAKEYFLKMGQ